MSLLDQIKSDRMEAMKAKEQLRKSTLTTLIGDAETINKGPNGPMTNDKMVALVKKHITGLRESLNLGALPWRCLEEINILTEYLPVQLDHEGIESILDDAIVSGKVASLGDAMKFLKESYAGQYDGKVASKIAKNLFD